LTEDLNELLNLNESSVRARVKRLLSDEIKKVETELQLEEAKLKAVKEHQQQQQQNTHPHVPGTYDVQVRNFGGFQG